MHSLVLFLGFPERVASVYDTVWFVHHSHEHTRVHSSGRTPIVTVQGGHTDVTNRSEFTAIVQMLVLETEEVPHESSGRSYLA